MDQQKPNTTELRHSAWFWKSLQAATNIIIFRFASAPEVPLCLFILDTLPQAGWYFIWSCAELPLTKSSLTVSTSTKPCTQDIVLLQTVSCMFTDKLEHHHHNLQTTLQAGEVIGHRWLAPTNRQIGVLLTAMSHLPARRGVFRCLQHNTCHRQNGIPPV